MIMSCNFYSCTEQFCKSDTNYEPQCDTVDAVCTGLLTDQFSTAIVIRDGMHS